MVARIVLSDLDGTLLDARTYDWQPALAALERLARLGVPVILTSSKTRAEIEVWRKLLHNEEVFVSENGGGVFFPEPGPVPAPREATAWDGYRRLAVGTPYDALRERFEEIRRETRLPLLGFGDMDTEEVMSRTDLGRRDAERARAREFDEPFVFETPADDIDLSALQAAAQARGLRVARGGRFFHLHGAHDKGVCVRTIAEAYGEPGRPAVTVGVGDSANDTDLLRAVDHACVVARSDGGHDRELMRALREATYLQGAGPEGFAQAITAVFGDA